MGKFSALEKANLTSNWTLEERSALGHFLEEKQFSTNQTLLSRKSEDRMLFLIERGQVRFAMEGAEIDLHEGESFGELSLVQTTSRITTAIALKETHVWVLRLDKWEDMKRAAPLIALKLLEAICQKMGALLGQPLNPGIASPSGSEAKPPSRDAFQ